VLKLKEASPDIKMYFTAFLLLTLIGVTTRFSLSNGVLTLHWKPISWTHSVRQYLLCGSCFWMMSRVDVGCIGACRKFLP